MAMLQRTQVSDEKVNFYLKKLNFLDQYGQAFKKLWTLWAENQHKKNLAASDPLGEPPHGKT
jgi:hypothetical protein